jgi:DNA-binding transcriptional ArsR family regulator
VEHPVRLDILGRLDRHPQTLSRLNAGIDRGEPLVAYHVQMLESAGLVEKAGDAAGRHTLYIARLKDHPCWIARAVNEHTLSSGGNKPV